MTEEAHDPDGRLLWCAVIHQALKDATNNSPYRSNERLHARQWLTSPNADFANVCLMAGYEANRVRNAMVKHLAAVDAMQKADGPGVGSNFENAPKDRRTSRAKENLQLEFS